MPSTTTIILKSDCMVRTPMVLFYCATLLYYYAHLRYSLLYIIKLLLHTLSPLNTASWNIAYLGNNKSDTQLGSAQ